MYLSTVLGTMGSMLGVVYLSLRTMGGTLGVLYLSLRTMGGTLGVLFPVLSRFTVGQAFVRP